MLIALLFVGILIVGFVIDRLFRSYFPRAHKVFNRVAWSIGGLFLLVAAVGALYTLITGKLL
jgi:hypothetical protein